MEKRYNNERWFTREDEKLGEKNTERSLVNAMNFEAVRSSGTFNLKDLHYDKRIEVIRPPALAKVRNSTSNDYIFHPEKRMQRTVEQRKQSEDIRSHVNQPFNDKMIENLRFKL